MKKYYYNGKKGKEEITKEQVQEYIEANYSFNLDIPHAPDLQDLMDRLEEGKAVPLAFGYITYE